MKPIYLMLLMSLFISGKTIAAVPIDTFPMDGGSHIVAVPLSKPQVVQFNVSQSNLTGEAHATCEAHLLNSVPPQQSAPILEFYTDNYYGAIREKTVSLNQPFTIDLRNTVVHSTSYYIYVNFIVYALSTQYVPVVAIKCMRFVV